MSGNRTFDYSFFYKRRQDLVNSRNQYLNNVNGQRIIYNTQLSDWNASRQNTFVDGAQTMYFRSVYGNGETISVGGIVNIPPFVESTGPSNILMSAPAPTPSPAPAPAPAPAPGTQLLINPEFTDIVSNGAIGWTSTRGWDAWGYQSGNKPTAVTTMPLRAGVYPTSTSTGFVIFSFQSATISQIVPITSLVGINTITGVLNIVNVSNNATDTFTFQIQYKDSTGTVLYTSTTGSIQAPSNWTDYTLTLTREGSPNFDLIKSITVNITGIDSGFWAGQYGPAMDYCRLTVS